MFNRNAKYKTLTVHQSKASIGSCIEVKGKVWKILAITGEVLVSSGYGGELKSLVYCEYQGTVIAKMKREISYLKHSIHKLKTVNAAKLEEITKDINDLQDMALKKGLPLNRNGVLENPPLSISPLSEDDGKEPRRLKANCGVCGAMLYQAESVFTFKEVFDIERPYCFHCGSKIEFINRIVK